MFGTFTDLDPRKETDLKGGMLSRLLDIGRPWSRVPESRRRQRKIWRLASAGLVELRIDAQGELQCRLSYTGVAVKAEHRH